MKEKRDSSTMNWVLLLVSLMWNEKEGAAEIQDCNSVVNNTLKSPGYPNNYPSNLDCTVTLPIPNEMTMNITFIYFDVEFSEPTCRFDYLKIKTSSGLEVGTYCGQETGTSTLVTGEYVEIVFHSDTSLEKKGFLLHFTVLSNVPPRITSLDPVEPIIPGDQAWCSATGSLPIYKAIVLMEPLTVLVNTTGQARVKLYQGGNYSCVAMSKYGIDQKDFPVIECGTVINGTLTSPGYPDSYPDAMRCGTSVAIPRAMQMQIYFIDFDLEESKDCNRDYLKITNEKNQEFGVYCGQGSGNEINVTGTSVFITFHTENATRSRGFKLHFEANVADCGSMVNNTLLSPGYPNDYPGNMNCTYSLQIPENKTLHITFVYFNLEHVRPSSSCPKVGFEFQTNVLRTIIMCR
ncbi:mannan-binding lectin serine protease 1-like [Stylophora pistillata]|uniref:mannan-binding lectin serine protease 1-like n=1 Tax=Stylophora pistillata TaxID=50429 RepID=UPI000C04F246|nr:mannan-binding lectin serine protease 1-like [Stylophora pistillata]